MSVSDEHHCGLAFYLQDTPDDWHGQYVTVVDPTETVAPIALVWFRYVLATYWGTPNDEAFSGHPLAANGVEPYAYFEVTDSPWCDQLSAMNAVHPYHRVDLYESYRHFIFAFHDTTFECLARSFDFAISQGTVAGAIPELLRRLNPRKAEHGEGGKASPATS